MSRLYHFFNYLSYTKIVLLLIKLNRGYYFKSYPYYFIIDENEMCQNLSIIKVSKIIAMLL